jgi:hypothetical protein
VPCHYPIFSEVRIEVLTRNKLSKENNISSPRKAYLIDNHGLRLELKSDFATISVGRGADNDVVIDDSTVSEYHATIAQSNGRFRLHDTNSSNGTAVNGKSAADTPLADGDLVQFGNARFTVRIGEPFIPMTTCLGCNQPVELGAPFCSRCGASQSVGAAAGGDPPIELNSRKGESAFESAPMTIAKPRHCTKCGRLFPVALERCASCGAVRFEHNAGQTLLQQRRGVGIKLGVCIFLIVGSMVLGEIYFGGWQVGSSKSIGTSELASSTTGSSSAQQASESPLSGQGMLLLPNASHEFLGTWGGYKRLDNGERSAEAFTFGVQKGSVYLAFEYYGWSDCKVNQKTVDILNTRRIELTIESICQIQGIAVRQVDNTRLSLTGGSTMQDDSRLSYFSQGFNTEVAHMNAHASLRLLTQTEAIALEKVINKDITDRGLSDQGRVESGQR